MQLTLLVAINTNCNKLKLTLIIILVILILSKTVVMTQSLQKSYNTKHEILIILLTLITHLEIAAPGQIITRTLISLTTITILMPETTK